MDILILIGGFTVLCLIGMPVAYALGLAAIVAGLITRRRARGQERHR